MQVATSNLTDEQVASMIASKNADVSIRLYELLPQFVQAQDADGIIRGFFEAVQEEYDRNKASITDVIAIIDPRNINKNYSVSGNLVFFHPEQFMYGAVASNPRYLAMTGPNPGVAGSGFYRDFGVFVWADPGNPASVGQYRIVSSYDGTSRTATLDLDWTEVPSASAIYALCWPDRVWLPVPLVSDPRRAGGTLFPEQVVSDISADAFNVAQEDIDGGKVLLLPGLSYIATVDDYYKGWMLDFLDGNNAGRSVEIVGYRSRPEGNVVVLDKKVVLPAAGDWFRITPPGVDRIGVSDNFYKNRWMHVSSSTLTEVSYGSSRLLAQSRQIISSRYDVTTTPVSHVAYVYDPITGDGQRFQSPPPPTVSYGISDSYVPIQNLASYVGIELDEEDPEQYQREQISQAYNFHRLKGTRRALELVCRSFGLDLEIDEVASNYTRSLANDEVGPSAAIEGNHVYYTNSEINPPILQGRGVDDVPAGYLVQPGKDAARIPDSDIRIYLARNNTNILPFDGKVLFRILKKLSPHIPIHVQIIFVGLLTRIPEKVAVDANLNIDIGLTLPEAVGVHEAFIGTPIGQVPETDAYTLNTDDDVAISTPARYSRMTARYGRFGAIPANSRWRVGTLLFVE